MKKSIGKLTLALSVSLFLFSCSKSKPFSEIKVGMPAAKVTELVGQPEEKTPMMGFEWWVYKGDNKLVVMSPDTVMRVVPDLKAAQDSMKMTLDMFNDKMKEIQNQ